MKAFRLLLLVCVASVGVNFAVVSYAIAQAKSAGTNSVSSWFETRFVLSWDDSVLLKKYNEALNLYISKGPEYKTKYEAWQKRCVDVADNQIAFLGSVKRDGMDCPETFEDLRTANHNVELEYACMTDNESGKPFAMLGNSREAVLLTMTAANRLVLHLMKTKGAGQWRYELNLKDVKKALKQGDYKKAKRWLHKPFAECHPILGGDCGNRYMYMLMDRANR
jgi:hypothetical protein